jgi:hypothetical protein
LLRAEPARVPLAAPSRWESRCRAADGVCRPFAWVGSSTDSREPEMILMRYLDVCLVLLTAPFVVLAGMPLLGYLVGTAAWLLTRVGAAAVHTHALHVGAMLGRVWIVALAVVLARYAGGKDDGIMAAALVLGAFTVYFSLTLVYRGPGHPGSAGTLEPGTAVRLDGKPSPS